MLYANNCWSNNTIYTYIGYITIYTGLVLNSSVLHFTLAPENCIEQVCSYKSNSTENFVVEAK